jgi:predicted dehydrogenase/nucleoside-diphosphate-sugar epimerase
MDGASFALRHTVRRSLSFGSGRTPAELIDDGEKYRIRFISNTLSLNQMEYRKRRMISASAKLRIGILGAGQMGRQHARAIGRLADAHVTAVVDPDPAALEEMQRIQPTAIGFTSFEDLLRSQEIDVLHVCTPPHTHEALTEQALEAGYHVYVEKPFVETHNAATRLAKLADRHGLKICAGHQLLYEPPTRRALEVLPTLGELTHIESYFSFRATKHTASGRAPLRDDLQLLDILPHPVYLLLEFLERAVEGTTQLASVQIGPRGTVHALVRRGSLTATLVVTLDGRPVESYLRLVGTNGSLHADYVRSTVQCNIGPGASGIDKLLSPYRLAWQLLTGTTQAMGKRFIKRQQSYPGLAEIFGALYKSIRENAPSPVSRSNLIETVAICETIAESLRAAYPVSPSVVRPLREAPVVITGGTGILGREVARALLSAGEQVRIVARRTPPGWDKIPGATYVVADISQPIAADVMAGAQTIVHCAAETAGRWEQHQRNSVDATEHVMRAAAAARVKRMIHISSISVLAVPGRGELLSESTPFEANSRTGGPNAWGKIESEKLAMAQCRELGIDLRVVRPSALVDYRFFDPPGLLGRRLGNIFVAVGMPGHKLGVVDVVFSGQTIAWMVRHFDEAPHLLNLFEPELPTKRELLGRLRRMNPDLTVVWLYPIVLVPLSWFAFGLQKVLRPRSPALSIAKMFARLQYDTSRISGLAPAIRAEFTHPAQDEVARAALPDDGAFVDGPSALQSA